MTLLNWIFVAWVAITVALTGLLIYRSILSMKEDDQLFLDPAEHQLEEARDANIRSQLRLAPMIRLLGSSSACLFAVLLGVVIYRTMPAW